ncbi:hypothetical protein ABEV04_11565 [Heyndrickxia faecalis]|uniref:hypothetical protein n=1 Tax=Heyndrickxia TaxID=2837504 RepID=UPI000791469E|nr:MULTISPECIES: hypothetical protein [Heyndrickxia]KYC62682.1 hypothetical protein B4100_0893 [Heyndrickxia coagulans]MED4976434.1 hypothetical protein [Weizmannia sp. CD-2023]UZH05009.1 hypothetical protein ONG97_08430 [Heyndrickxia coagulans]
MKSFDQSPKTIKKTIRFIRQDVESLETLNLIEKTLLKSIEVKKQELKDNLNL